MMICKNFATIDLRILVQCVPKINRFRVSKLLLELNKSIIADGIHPDQLDIHDKMFEPRNQYEKDFWESCRELAKKDIKILQQRVINGQKGGRPPMTAEEKKAKLEQAAKNIGEMVGQNQVKITPDFKLPDNEYFNAYRKELPKETESVERWLKTAKLDSIVDYDWIGKQIQKFKYNKTGKVL